MHCTPADPIVQLVHDGTRNLLYALTDRSIIHVIWLGADGQSFVRSVSHTSLREDARRMYPQTPLLDPTTTRILALHAVPQTESTNVHLIAVTNSGEA